MNSPESISGFTGTGETTLMPAYYFSARAIDALAPVGSTIVDLGCGSGQFLAYLAGCRTDLRITGIDLAEDMVDAGNEMLQRKALGERVRLVVGDMRDFRSVVQGRADLISSVFALHHLPSHSDLMSCLREIGRVVSAEGARLWLFDHARPKREATARGFPEIFGPRSSAAFKTDSRNSVRAAWSFEELREALGSTIEMRVSSSLARLFPLYQAHWLGEERSDADPATWRTREALLPPGAAWDAKSLARILRRPPGW